MDYPYSPEERVARRQFFQLFCGNYMYECERADALSEEPWTPEIIHDILITMYPDNPLTPGDIQAIIFLSGMLPRNRDHLYFGYRWESGVSREIIAAIGPYISNEAYIKLNHALRGAMATSVEEFYEACCMNAKIPERKISVGEAYDFYIRWCAANIKGGMTKKMFVKLMNKRGHRTLKGYINGKCGVNYLVMSIDEGRVDQFAEPRREAFQRKTQKVQETLDVDRSIDRGGAESSDETPGGETPAVLPSEDHGEVEQIKESGDANHGEDRETDGIYGIEDEIGGILTGFEIPADFIEDPNDRSTSDSLGESSSPEDGRSTAVERSEDGSEPTKESIGGESGRVPTEDIRRRVNHLPKEQRDAFKELKFTYRALSEPPTIEDFRENCNSWGFEPTQELFELFLEYLRS